MDPRVLEAMLPFFMTHFGNPSSLHSHGSEPRAAVAKARGAVAALVNASPDDVIFTGSATEASNLAILGTASKAGGEGHIITSAIEHFSILNPIAHLGKAGLKVTMLPVDKQAVVDPAAIRAALTEDTILVSIGYANGEVGTIQDMRTIGEMTSKAGVPLHVDAVAAAAHAPIDMRSEHIDMLTLSANDLYGPKGVGALVLAPKMKAQLDPLLFGGGHERGLRSGSENVPGIVGMGKAAALAKAEMPKNSAFLRSLRDRLIKGVTSEIKDSYLNGHPERRLPNNANLRFSFVEGEGLLLNLDMEGISVSTSSACTSKTLEASHVLKAMGVSHEEAHGALLFVLSKENNEVDIDHVITRLPPIVDRLRAMSPLTPKGYLEEELDTDKL